MASFELWPVSGRAGDLISGIFFASGGPQLGRPAGAETLMRLGAQPEHAGFPGNAPP